LNRREVLILEEIIAREGVCTYKDLAISVNINERTIRYDIDKINKKLEIEGTQTIEKLGKGMIKLSNYYKIKEIITSSFTLDLAPKVRDKLLYLRVIFNEIINLNLLSEELKVSRTTIKNSLKTVKEQIDHTTLSLELLPKKGLALLGREEDIRKLQLEFLIKNRFTKTDKDIHLHYITTELEKIYHNVDIDKVKKYILKIAEQLNKVISDETYTILASYLIVASGRCFLGRYLNSYPNQVFISRTKEYQVIRKSAGELEEILGVDLNNYEVFKVTDYFLGIQNYSLDESFFHNWIEIDSLTQEIIRNFSHHFKVNVYKDKLLFKGLVNHIKPAIHRINNDIQLKNDISEEVIEEYSNLYLSTLYSLRSLEKSLNKSIPKDEIAFIALHFKGAVDRCKRSISSTKRLLIICGLGYGTSYLIADQIKGLYDVEIVDIIPFNQLQEYNMTKNNIDLVITTLNPQKIRSHLPIIKVNVILSHKDISVLNTYKIPKKTTKTNLSSLISAIKKSCSIQDENLLISNLKDLMSDRLVCDIERKNLLLSDMLKEENISLEVEANTWEEAIRIAGKKMIISGMVTDRYIDSIVEIVNEFGDYMVTKHGLALPHSRSNNGSVIRSGMVFVVLKNPVLFPEKTPVKYILTFASRDSIEHLDCLNTFIDLVSNHNFLKKVDMEDNRKIHSIIKKYEFLSKIGSKENN